MTWSLRSLRAGYVSKKPYLPSGAYSIAPLSVTSWALTFKNEKISIRENLSHANGIFIK
jgi:hypothetical protein